MNGYLPKKAIVFFNPGKPGIVSTHEANTFITVEELIKAQAHLVQMTNNPVIYIEDRRLKPR